MPTPAMAADLMLTASIPGLEQKIAQATGAGFSTGLDGEMKAEMKKLTKSMFAARRDAIKLGRKKEADALRVLHDQKLASIKSLYRTQQALEKDLKGSMSAEDKKAKQAALAHTMTMIAKNQQAIKDETKKRTSADAHRLKLMQEGLESAARSFGEKMEDSLTGFGDKFESVLQQAMSAENLDLGALIKGGGQSLKGSAPTLISGGKKMAAFGAKTGGMLGKAAAALGSGAAALGAAAGVLAGAAAVVAAFVAVIMAAYGQTKEFNKAILEGSSAVDMLGSEALDSAAALSQELAKVRIAAMTTALEFRSTSEEVLAMASAMNQSGFTYREQTKVFGDYSASMRQAQITTQAFGVGAGEYAESVNQMTRDFAYGQQSIAEGFQDIFGAAQMSGMGVKNFFTAISETTSGMALYNFKLEDTLELMLGLEKMLGEDLSREVMGSLKGKYRGASTQERFKANMTAGSAGVQVLQTFMKSAEQGFKTALGDASVESQIAVANRGGVEGMRTMSSRDLAALANEIQAAGDEALARKVLGLGRAQRGGARGAGLGARSEALGELDQAGTMAFSMSQAYGVLGPKALSDMSGTTKMAFEEITGLSGEMLTAYQDVFARAEARAAGQGGATDFKSVIEGIQTGDLLSAEDKAALHDAQEDANMTMEEVAQQQLKETQSILNLLKTGVVMMLELIYDGLFGFLPGTEDVAGARRAMEKAQALRDASPEDETLAANAAMAVKAYEAVLQGGTTAGVYEQAAAKLTQEQQLAAGSAAVGGEAVGIAAERNLTGAGYGALTGLAMGGPMGAVTGAAKGAGIASLTSAYDYFTDLDLDKTFGEMNKTEQESVAVATTAASDQKKAEADALRQDKKTNEELTELQKILQAGGMSKLADMIDGQGFKGNFDDKEAIKSFLREGEGGLTGPEKTAAIAAGITFDDFIYRGNGTSSGTINPINSADDFYGAKPGGAIANALNGRGVSINSIVVYESGDQRKTLAMIKQGVETAMRKA